MTAVEEAPRLLTVREAAARIGMSERWTRQKVITRELPVVCLDRRRMIRPADLDEFVSERVERAS